MYYKLHDDYNMYIIVSSRHGLLFDQYKRNTGKVFTSSDGYKYFCHKSKEKFLYLRCVFFRKDCKGSAKLEKATNLI